MARGNFDYDQVRDSARHGLTGPKFQMFAGGSVAGNVPKFDGEGNLIDSGKAASLIGGGGGGNWPYGAMVAPPDASSFSAIHASPGGSLITTGNFLISKQGTSDFSAYVKAAPSAPFRWTVWGDLAWYPQNFFHLQFVVRRAESARMLGLGQAYQAGGLLRWCRWASDWSQPSIVDSAWIFGGRICVQFEWDGINIVARAGSSPQTLRRTKAETAAAFLGGGPNQIGIINAVNNAAIEDAYVLSVFDWREEPL